MVFEPKPEPDDPHDTCRIKIVYHLRNGMAMVFCEHGQQMPYYQGPSDIMRARIDAKMASQERVEERIMPEGAWSGLATRR